MFEPLRPISSGEKRVWFANQLRNNQRQIQFKDSRQRFNLKSAFINFQSEIQPHVREGLIRRCTSDQLTTETVEEFLWMLEGGEIFELANDQIIHCMLSIVLRYEKGGIGGDSGQYHCQRMYQMIQQIIDAQVVCQGKQRTSTIEELFVLKNCYKKLIQLLHKSQYFFGLFEKLSTINNVQLHSLALKQFLFKARMYQASKAIYPVSQFVEILFTFVSQGIQIPVKHGQRVLDYANKLLIERDLEPEEARLVIQIICRLLKENLDSYLEYIIVKTDILGNLFPLLGGQTQFDPELLCLAGKIYSSEEVEGHNVLIEWSIDVFSSLKAKLYSPNRKMVLATLCVLANMLASGYEYVKNFLRCHIDDCFYELYASLPNKHKRKMAVCVSNILYVKLDEEMMASVVHSGKILECIEMMLGEEDDELSSEVMEIIERLLMMVEEWEEEGELQWLTERMEATGMMRRMEEVAAKKYGGFNWGDK